MPFWNPWHGCRKISAGCQNCYVYRIDHQHGRDTSTIVQTQSFDLPLRHDRHGHYKIQAGTLVYTCFSSDFLLAEADEWRPRVWEIMRLRPDLNFYLTTKRIDRLTNILPSDWGPTGYTNVTICCTVENQDRAEYRLPLYCSAPLNHRIIICEPLLGPINLRSWLATGRIDEVIAGGESGPNARPCDYEWILSLRAQCQAAGIKFSFHQTGSLLRKEGQLFHIPRKLQHAQAHKAKIDLL